MFCHNCGKQIPDGTSFCRYCGAAQNKVQHTPASAAAPHARAAAPNGKSQQKKSSGSSVFANILSIAVIVVVVGFIFFYDTDNAASHTSVSSSQAIPSFVDGIKSPGSDSLSQPAAPAPVVDNRIPDYRQTVPRWETLRYEWYCLNGYDVMWLETSIDVQMYTYYRSLDRYYDVKDYYHYIADENNREIIRQIVSAIQDVGNSLSYSDMDMIREIVKFVQDVIEYEYDIDTTGEMEYPRYPIETLYERRGDCEDTSILMAAMVRELGYEVGFLDLPGHIAVAVRAADDYDSSSYYEINGKRYVYIESTGSGWNIGDIPDDFLQTEVEFFLIP